MRGDERGAFFRRAIDIRGKKLAMPMQLFGSIGLVLNVDGDGLALFEAQQRTGELTVIDSRRDNAIGSQFHRLHGDYEGVIRGAAGLRSRLLLVGHGGLLAAGHRAERRTSGDDAGGFGEVPSRQARN